MKDSKKGFVGVALLIILGLLVVGGGAYYFGTRHSAEAPAQVSTGDQSGSVPKLNDYSNPSTNTTVNTPNTTSGNVSNTTNWKTYTNAQYGFQFQYSSEIIFPSPTSNPRNVFALQSKNSISSPILGLYISLLKDSGENTLQNDKDTLTNGRTGIQIKNLTIGGNPGFMASHIDKEVSDVGGHITYTANSIVETFKDGNIYAFECSQNGTDTSECNQTISTFKFTQVAQNTDWKTYSDFGFSFNYPNNIVLAPTGARFAVDFFLDNPSDANMVTFSAEDPVATCDDMDNAIGPNGVHNYKGEMKIINGVSFHKAESSEGFAGGSAHSIDYYTVHNNLCFDLRFSHASYTSTLSESTAISMFENIVATFKLKN